MQIKPCIKPVCAIMSRFIWIVLAVIVNVTNSSDWFESVDNDFFGVDRLPHDDLYSGDALSISPLTNTYDDEVIPHFENTTHSDTFSESADTPSESLSRISDTESSTEPIFSIDGKVNRVSSVFRKLRRQIGYRFSRNSENSLRVFFGVYDKLRKEHGYNLDANIRYVYRLFSKVYSNVCEGGCEDTVKFVENFLKFLKTPSSSHFRKASLEVTARGRSEKHSEQIEPIVPSSSNLNKIVSNWGLEIPKNNENWTKKLISKVSRTVGKRLDKKSEDFISLFIRSYLSVAKCYDKTSRRNIRDFYGVFENLFSTYKRKLNLDQRKSFHEALLKSLRKCDFGEGWWIRAYKGLFRSTLLESSSGESTENEKAKNGETEALPDQVKIYSPTFVHFQNSRKHVKFNVPLPKLICKTCTGTKKPCKSCHRRKKPCKTKNEVSPKRPRPKNWQKYEKPKPTASASKAVWTKAAEISKTETTVSTTQTDAAAFRKPTHWNKEGTATLKPKNDIFPKWLDTATEKAKHSTYYDTVKLTQSDTFEKSTGGSNVVRDVTENYNTVKHEENVSNFTSGSENIETTSEAIPPTKRESTQNPKSRWTTAEGKTTSVASENDGQQSTTHSSPMTVESSEKRITESFTTPTPYVTHTQAIVTSGFLKTTERLIQIPDVSPQTTQDENTTVNPKMTTNGEVLGEERVTKSQSENPAELSTITGNPTGRTTERVAPRFPPRPSKVVTERPVSQNTTPIDGSDILPDDDGIDRKPHQSATQTGVSTPGLHETSSIATTERNTNGGSIGLLASTTPVPATTPIDGSDILPDDDGIDRKPHQSATQTGVSTPGLHKTSSIATTEINTNGGSTGILASTTPVPATTPIDGSDKLPDDEGIGRKPHQSTTQKRASTPGLYKTSRTATTERNTNGGSIGLVASTTPVPAPETSTKASRELPRTSKHPGSSDLNGNDGMPKTITKTATTDVGNATAETTLSITVSETTKLAFAGETSTIRTQNVTTSTPSFVQSTASTTSPPKIGSTEVTSSLSSPLTESTTIVDPGTKMSTHASGDILTTSYLPASSELTDDDSINRTTTNTAEPTVTVATSFSRTISKSTTPASDCKDGTTYTRGQVTESTTPVQVIKPSISSSSELLTTSEHPVLGKTTDAGKTIKTYTTAQPQQRSTTVTSSVRSTISETTTLATVSEGSTSQMVGKTTTFTITSLTTEETQLTSPLINTSINSTTPVQTTNTTELTSSEQPTTSKHPITGEVTNVDITNNTNVIAAPTQHQNTTVTSFLKSTVPDTTTLATVVKDSISKMIGETRTSTIPPLKSEKTKATCYGSSPLPQSTTTASATKTPLHTSGELATTSEHPVSSGLTSTDSTTNTIITTAGTQEKNVTVASSLKSTVPKTTTPGTVMEASTSKLDGESKTSKIEPLKADGTEAMIPLTTLVSESTTPGQTTKIPLHTSSDHSMTSELSTTSELPVTSDLPTTSQHLITRDITNADITPNTTVTTATPQQSYTTDGSSLRSTVSETTTLATVIEALTSKIVGETKTTQVTSLKNEETQVTSSLSTPVTESTTAVPTTKIPLHTLSEHPTTRKHPMSGKTTDEDKTNKISTTTALSQQRNTTVASSLSSTVPESTTLATAIEASTPKMAGETETSIIKPHFTEETEVMSSVSTPIAEGTTPDPATKTKLYTSNEPPTTSERPTAEKTVDASRTNYTTITTAPPQERNTTVSSSLRSTVSKTSTLSTGNEASTSKIVGETKSSTVIPLKTQGDAATSSLNTLATESTTAIATTKIPILTSSELPTTSERPISSKTTLAGTATTFTSATPRERKTTLALRTSEFMTTASPTTVIQLDKKGSTAMSSEETELSEDEKKSGRVIKRPFEASAKKPTTDKLSSAFSQFVPTLSKDYAIKVGEKFSAGKDAASTAPSSSLQQHIPIVFHNGSSIATPIGNKTGSTFTRAPLAYTSLYWEESSTNTAAIEGNVERESTISSTKIETTTQGGRVSKTTVDRPSTTISSITSEAEEKTAKTKMSNSNASQDYTVIEGIKPYSHGESQYFKLVPFNGKEIVFVRRPTKTNITPQIMTALIKNISISHPNAGIIFQEGPSLAANITLDGKIALGPEYTVVRQPSSKNAVINDVSSHVTKTTLQPRPVDELPFSTFSGMDMVVQRDVEITSHVENKPLQTIDDNAYWLNESGHNTLKSLSELTITTNIEGRPVPTANEVDWWPEGQKEAEQFAMDLDQLKNPALYFLKQAEIKKIKLSQKQVSELQKPPQIDITTNVEGKAVPTVDEKAYWLSGLDHIKPNVTPELVITTNIEGKSAPVVEGVNWWPEGQQEAERFAMELDRHPNLAQYLLKVAEGKKIKVGQKPTLEILTNIDGRVVPTVEKKWWMENQEQGIREDHAPRSSTTYLEEASTITPKPMSPSEKTNLVPSLTITTNIEGKPVTLADEVDCWPEGKEEAERFAVQLDRQPQLFKYLLKLAERKQIQVAQKETSEYSGDFHGRVVPIGEEEVWLNKQGKKEEPKIQVSTNIDGKVVPTADEKLWWIKQDLLKVNQNSKILKPELKISTNIDDRGVPTAEEKFWWTQSNSGKIVVVGSSAAKNELESKNLPPKLEISTHVGSVPVPLADEREWWLNEEKLMSSGSEEEMMKTVQNMGKPTFSMEPKLDISTNVEGTRVPTPDENEWWLKYTQHGGKHVALAANGKAWGLGDQQIAEAGQMSGFQNQNFASNIGENFQNLKMFPKNGQQLQQNIGGWNQQDTNMEQWMPNVRAIDSINSLDTEGRNIQQWIQNTGRIKFNQGLIGGGATNSPNGMVSIGQQGGQNRFTYLNPLVSAQQNGFQNGQYYIY